MDDIGFWGVVRLWLSQKRDRDWTREDNALLVAFAVFAAVVAVDAAGIELWLLRTVIVVPFLTFVPGYLILRIVGLHPRDLTTGLLYAVGTSLVFLMFYAFVLNMFLPLVGIESVFTEWTLLVAVLGAVGGLYFVYDRRVEPIELPVRRVAVVWDPWVFGLMSIPFVAVLGARTVTRFGNNGILLGLFVVIGALAVAAYLDLLPKRLFPLAIFAIAAALLLHNSVLNHALAWDAGKEHRLATLVVQNGVWDPNVGGRWMKNAMLRIVLLHPIYSLLADVNLLWEFKTISPLLFAFAPVAFYKSYQTVVDRNDAFLAALLPMSFFSFFTVLSVNSRTSGALLFLGLVALTITDRSLGQTVRRGLLLCFFAGLIVSHYGMTYIALAAMSMVLVGHWILLGPRKTENVARTRTTFVIFIGLLTLAWYIFIVHQAWAFARLVSFSYEFFGDLIQDLLGQNQAISGEESKTVQYAQRRYTSNTIRWLQRLYFVLGGAAALGTGMELLQRLWDRYVRGGFGVSSGNIDLAQTEYLLYATAFLGVFGLTFLGVDKLNTARTLMPALLFFAPFAVRGPKRLGPKLAPLVDVNGLKQAGKVVLLCFVLVFFVLNVGLYGSLVGEYHPNIMTDKERVVESGTLPEKHYFWDMHYETIQDIRTETWLSDHGATGDGYHYLDSRQVISGLYNCTNVPRQPLARQGSCDSEPTFDTDGLNKTYVTSGTTVFYNASAG